MLLYLFSASLQTASVVLTALSKNDAGPGTTVLDLGCGTGMLGFGFALVHSDMVYLVDCDLEALELARENLDALVEEELIGNGGEGEGGGCCIGLELIAAKVKYVARGGKLQGGNSGAAGSGRGHRGGNFAGRGRKGRDRVGGGKARGRENPSREESSTISTQAKAQLISSVPPNDLLSCNPSIVNDDGLPFPSKIVDTVITNPPF